MERKDIITAKGKPLTLTGTDLKPGDRAPQFLVLDGEMNEVRLSDFPGKIMAISVTPSLDTPVCDLQIRRFNQEAAGLADEVVILNISMDLPFAVSRFCAGAGIDKVRALSDHRDASFGTNYGVLIKELRLLARALFIIDRSGIIRYIEIVPEITDHPDYERALETLRGMLKLPDIPDREFLDMSSNLDEGGYLIHFDSWDEKTAVALAEREGVKGLSQEHIAILSFIRQHYSKYHSFPCVTATCMQIRQPRTCLREEFMTQKQAWKLAGLPNPDKSAQGIMGSRAAQG